MRLVRLLLQLRPDVVHAYLPVANVYAAAATLATAGRARLIVSKRALCGYKKGRPVLAAAERAADRIADRILVNSNAVADAVAHVEGAPADKMRTIYNGVDAVTFRSNRERGILRREFGLPEDSRLVVTVSNLRSVKGLDDFVEAARSVCEEHPNVRFAFVGRDDGEGVRLRRQAVELGIESALLFAGARRDVPEVLADADLLVQPSLSEGFSNVVLEGMAAGKPVVATDVGGNPEAIEDGVTGLLVPPRRPDILASAINRVLDDPQLSASLGEAAQRKVLQSFTIELMIHNMESLYDELLGRRECDGRDRY